MKEYKVEKITKNDALDKVNKNILNHIFNTSLAAAVMAIGLYASTITPAIIILLFPLVEIQGRVLDRLDSDLQTKEKIINSPDDTVFDVFNSYDKSLTDEKMQEILNETRSKKR